MVFGCLEETSISDGRFLGTWTSPDVGDTLIFTSDQFFYKSDSFMHNHSYEYSYTNIDITIQYKGPNMIYVEPTTHSYEFYNDDLIIDFSGGCYGFESVVSKYTKVLF